MVFLIIEFVRTELKLLEAIRYKLSFFSVHQLVKYLIDLVRQKYGIEVDSTDVYGTLKTLFATDLYFLANPVTVCVYAVFNASKNFIVKENFFKIFEKSGVDGEEMKRLMASFETTIASTKIPTGEEIERALKRLDEISRLAAAIRRTSVPAHPP
jgi:hypothetical protein